MKKHCIIWTISKEELVEIVKKSESYSEAYRHLGYVNGGRSYDSFKKRILIDNIDCSHFSERKYNNKRIGVYKNEDVFVENSNYGTKGLKNRIIKYDLKPYTCEICGMNPEWNGKKLVLVLDHKNGNSHDNRLDNLRFLCPNCNSQQPTFAGGNTKRYRKKYYCPDCNKQVTRNGTRCKECSIIFKNKTGGRNQYSGVKPNKEELINDLINIKVITSIADKYSVSDNCVRKWLRKNRLPYNKKDIVKYTQFPSQ